MSRLAASVVLVGVALIGVTAPAHATKGHDKPSVCHPTGSGFVLIKPAQASSHIDEAKFPNGKYWKHEHNGRHDVYAVSGACPVEPSTPSPATTGGTPSTPSATPTHTSASPTATSTSSTTSWPTSTSPSPSHTSSTPSVSTSAPSSTPTSPATTSTPRTTSASPSSTSPKPSSASAPSMNSPRRSVPSSTVAPPNQLAHTGADIGSLLVLAAILLIGGAFILISRKGRRH